MAARRGFIERATERLGDGLVQFGEQVAVSVEGHVDRRVTHPRLDRLGVGTGRNGKCHTRVPQVVESARHSGRDLRLGEVVRQEARRRERIARSVGEHQGIWTRLRERLEVG